MAAVLLLCDLGRAAEPLRWVVCKCAGFEAGPLPRFDVGLTEERARRLVNDEFYTETVGAFFTNTMEGFSLFGDRHDPVVLEGLEDHSKTLDEQVRAMAERVWAIRASDP